MTPAADTEPLRCIVQMDLDGTISVLLVDECSAEDAYTMCELIARCDPSLEQVRVHQLPCCHALAHTHTTHQAR